MEDTLESFYSTFEEYLIVDTNVWAYVLIAGITIIVLFYGTRYVFTGVNVTAGANDNIPYKRCNVGPRAAVVSMKGHRQYMEDTYQAVPSFGGRDNWSFYGVFDGHGGARCSVYVAHFLYKHVWSCIDLYLEHYSLNSNNLWKLLLNDENLITITHENTNNNNKINENTNPNMNNPNIKNNDKSNNNENETKNEIKILKTDENNEDLINGNSDKYNINSHSNSNNTAILTSEAVKETETMPLLSHNDESDTDNDNNGKREGFKSQSLSVISQRGSDISDLDNNNNNNTIDTTSTKGKTETKKLIGIPKYVNEIMREALIQSHRYADKEFLAMANRQQWQDGSTSISCVILPAKDILHALMNDERNGVIRDENGTNNNTNNAIPSTNNTTNMNNNNNDKNDISKDDHEQQRALYSIPGNIMPSQAFLNDVNVNDELIKNNNLTIDDICDDKDTWMFIANTGDSRAILVTNNGQAVPLSTDHKPNSLSERRRIEEKGGRVVFFGVWRVEGVLAVSRAFGDRRLKRWVVPDPEIISRKVGDNDLFVVLASDGVWDAVSNEQAARYAYEVWNDASYSNADLKTKLQAIAGKISSMAFRHGSMDNITALVVHIPTHCTYGIGFDGGDGEVSGVGGETSVTNTVS